jgi:hypothetical protein
LQASKKYTQPSTTDAFIKPLSHPKRCSDDDFEDEPFMIGDMLIEMIVGTEQDATVVVISKDDDDVEDI